jgi:hypothetical protein
MPTAVKRLLFVVVLGALVVGAAGCDLSPPAATVNGATISQSTLNDALSTEITSGTAQCAVQVQANLKTGAAGVGTEGDGTTPNAVTPGFADSVLESLVLAKIEEGTLAQHKVTVTAADVEAAKADYVGQLTQQLQQDQSASTTPTGCTISSSSSIAGQLPAAFLQRQAVSLADQEMFEVAVGHVDLSESALEAYYRSHETQVTQVCLNAIVSDTQAAAQTVHDAIAAGTSFATASTSAGADQQVGPSGGQLPCEYPATLAQQLPTLAATIGALSTGQLAEPLAFQATNSTGAATTFYLVVQMRQRLLVPFATLRSSVRQAILGQHAAIVQTTLKALVARAHVSVDPRYGSWSANGGVAVPTPPPPAFVPHASANVPAPPVPPGLHLNLAP